MWLPCGSKNTKLVYENIKKNTTHPPPKKNTTLGPCSGARDRPTISRTISRTSLPPQLPWTRKAPILQSLSYAKKILSPDPILKLTRGFFPVKICVWYMEWRILKALTLLLDLEVLLSPEFLCHKHFWGEYIPVAIANTCMACLDVFLFQMMSMIYSRFFFPPLGWCLWKDSLVMMMFSRYSTHMFQTQHVGTCWSTLLHLTLQ